MPERSEKICVVDDDMSLLKALDRLLGSAGLQTLPFNDPRLFLEHVRNHPVALAILDVSMPQINGLEVQRLLRDMAPATPGYHDDRPGQSGGGQTCLRPRGRRFFC